MTHTTTARLAGREAARTANRHGGRRTPTRRAKRTERHTWRVEASREIAALGLVTVR